MEGFYKAALESLKQSSGMRQTAEHYGDESLIEKAFVFHAGEHTRLHQEARALVIRLKEDMLIR